MPTESAHAEMRCRSAHPRRTAAPIGPWSHTLSRAQAFAAAACVLGSLFSAGAACALDRPVARPPAARSETFEGSGDAGAVPGPQSYVTARTCPFKPETLTLPPWNAALARNWFRIALEHRVAIGNAMLLSVHHFAGVPSPEQFEEVFASDADEARAAALDIRRAADTHDPGLLSIFAVLYVAREQRSLGGAQFVLASSAAEPDYDTLADRLSSRLLIGLTRLELSRLPSSAEWIDDPTLLLEHRDAVAPLLGRVGFALDDQIRHEPGFLACVAMAPTAIGVDDQELRGQVEIVGRNAAALDEFLRFTGVDLDAELKAYARAQPGGSAGVDHVGAGVSYDSRNHVAYLDARPTRVTIHTDVTAREANADFAALISQWEHGELGDVTCAQMDALVRGARRDTPPGPLADLLDAAAFDLRTHYGVDDQSCDWSRPRVGRWERTIVGRDDYTTFYDLQLDTRGRYAVPGNDTFTTKRIDSPVGMVLGVGLGEHDLPPRALAAFAEHPPSLHIALIPDPGLTVEVFTHPKSLTRKPGVPASASWETPLEMPPAAGWEIRPFGHSKPATEDSVLFDVRPVPGVAPGSARSFAFHACLLTPLDVRTSGRTVWFSSPIWRSAADIPSTARFLVYRREARGDAPWTDLAGAPLTLKPGPDYPSAKVSPIQVATRDGFVELSLEDHAARSDRTYEYRVLHRCSIKPYPDETTVHDAPENLRVSATSEP